VPEPFVQERHREPWPLDAPRPLVIGLAPMNSAVNVSQIARAAASSGVDHMIVCGNQRLDPKISRLDEGDLDIRRRRSLAPAARKLQLDGYQVVAVEQTTHSTPLPEHRFARRTLLLVGNERLGVPEDCLEVADVAVEIPVFHRPHSFNAAMSACIALYEYCRQFPAG
jgi:tRNA G18 (ribose-2'-O)-methylase SpoU